MFRSKFQDKWNGMAHVPTIDRRLHDLRNTDIAPTTLTGQYDALPNYANGPALRSTRLR